MSSELNCIQRGLVNFFDYGYQRKECIDNISSLASIIIIAFGIAYVAHSFYMNPLLTKATINVLVGTFGAGVVLQLLTIFWTTVSEPRKNPVISQ